MSYKNLSELISSMQGDLEQMEKEALSVGDLDRIQENARELYERITVLKYQAIERLVKPEEVEQPKVETVMETTTEEETGVPEEVEEEKPTIRFNIKPVVEETPKNQRNLLDEIQERTEEKKELVEEPAPVEKVETPTPVVPAPETAEPTPVATSEDKSVNAKFADEQPMSLADKLKRQPISNLLDAIGMNEKFLFMNDLFEGERDAFYESIEHLNSLSNYLEADDYIQNNLTKKYGWDLEGQSAQRFIELVERRYLA